MNTISKFIKTYKSYCNSIESKKSFNSIISTFSDKKEDVALKDQFVRLVSTLKNDDAAEKKFNQIKNPGTLLCAGIVILNSDRFKKFTASYFTDKAKELGATNEMLNAFAAAIGDDKEIKPEAKVDIKPNQDPEEEVIVINLKKNTNRPTNYKKKPSDIKKLADKSYKQPTEIIVGDIYNLSGNNRVTEDVTYYKSVGNGYITDKQGVIYDVKTNSYSSDSGRIANGTQNWETIIYNVGDKNDTIYLSGYRGVLSSPSSETAWSIVSDIRSGYFLEDYLAKHKTDITNKSKLSEDTLKLINLGDPDAKSFDGIKEDIDNFNKENFISRYFCLDNYGYWYYNNENKLIVGYPEYVNKEKQNEKEYININKVLNKILPKYIKPRIDSKLLIGFYFGGFYCKEQYRGLALDCETNTLCAVDYDTKKVISKTPTFSMGHYSAIHLINGNSIDNKYSPFARYVIKEMYKTNDRVGDRGIYLNEYYDNYVKLAANNRKQNISKLTVNKDNLAKMELWNKGGRVFNMKAANDDKLIANYIICLNKGYTQQSTELLKEIQNRNIDLTPFEDIIPKDKITTNSTFSEIKSNCKTKSQRLAFNKLINLFDLSTTYSHTK